MKPPPAFYDDLECMLNEGKTEEFYRAIDPHTRFNHDEDITRENSKNNVWICYLVARAPLIEDIYTPPGNVKDDVFIKSRACTRLMKCTWALNDGTVKDKNAGQLRLLIASCHARMINQVKNGFIKPDPEVKQKDDGKLIYIETEQQVKDLMKRVRSGNGNRHDAIRGRNNFIEARLETMEKQFVSNLVALFPGKESFVHQFILQAGYERSEIRGLIDKTVGRNSSTEFLYKKRSK